MTRQRTTTLFVMILGVFIILFSSIDATYARSQTKAKYYITNNMIIVHDIQLLLSIYGSSTVSIDGICGNKTKDAIKTYIATPSQRQNFTHCSGELLNTLINTVKLSASHVIPTGDSATINLLSSKIEAIKDDVIKHIDKRHLDIMAQFAANAAALQSSKSDSWTAIVTAISTAATTCLFALSIAFAWIQITKVETHHKEAISRATFNYYLTEALKNTILYSPPRFENRYDIPNRKIN